MTCEVTGGIYSHKKKMAAKAAAPCSKTSTKWCNEAVCVWGRHVRCQLYGCIYDSAYTVNSLVIHDISSGCSLSYQLFPFGLVVPISSYHAVKAASLRHVHTHTIFILTLELWTQHTSSNFVALAACLIVVNDNKSFLLYSIPVSLETFLLWGDNTSHSFHKWQGTKYFITEERSPQSLCSPLPTVL